MHLMEVGSWLAGHGLRGLWGLLVRWGEEGLEDVGHCCQMYVYGVSMYSIIEPVA